VKTPAQRNDIRIKQTITVCIAEIAIVKTIDV